MPTGPTLAADEVRRFRDAVLAGRRPDGDQVPADRERIELIAEAEKLKSTLCAIQAELSVDLDASVRSRDARQGVRPELQGRGVASQIALARRESPHRGSVLLGLAKDLATDLPCTLASLREGRLNEYRAQIVAKETGCLGREDRAALDEDICGTSADGTSPADSMGAGQLAGTLRRRAEEADPAAAVRRNAKAEKSRRVSIRPTPDTMVYVTGLLPVAQGVRAFAILSKEADALINTGDERTKGQIMADLFVERLTGQSQAADVGVTVDVVLSDQTLLGGGNESALLPGLPGGTLPAQIARELIAHALRAETVNWIRTLYTDPAGRLVALSTKQRFVTAGLADYLALRDQGLCRTPWCDAPARQADHITTAAHGGETSDDNTQGLCQACNLAKQAAGWAQRVVGKPGLRRGRHTVETTTPTGHRHRSQAPAPPTPARPGLRRQRRITHELYTRSFDLAIASDYAA